MATASSPIDAQLTQALEHQTRAILAELDKRFSAIDSKWELRVGALESQAKEFARHHEDISSTIRADVEAHLSAADADTLDRIRYWEASTGARVTALESAIHLLDTWRPRMGSSVDAFHTSMDTVHAELSKMEIQWSNGARVDGFSRPSLLDARESAPARSPAPVSFADGSCFGPRLSSTNRDCGFGPYVVDLHFPVKGFGDGAATLGFGGIARSKQIRTVWVGFGHAEPLGLPLDQAVTGPVSSPP
ncbi:uncharacterized protein LOC100502382 [Zea mays]|uniref:Uncharacterized protein n=1 Tax=Zea mays TaxID=4577 RepID=C4JAW7_MAIZE|nr:uncharacterized protein LOC100502382 [Zea mays]ACR38317.1 unknown [Zea mays]|eukprot:NP_001183789.1 uncharacterized protein LOC100502382 [Zea mays]